MATAMQAPTYPSVAERNFEFFTLEANPGVQYLRHPSGVIVLCLAAENEESRVPIERIEWSFSQKKVDKGDRSKVEVLGKSKKVDYRSILLQR